MTTALKTLIALTAAVALSTACSEDDTSTWEDRTPPQGEEGWQYIDANNTYIPEYDGQKASDADKDTIRADEDIYWEANTFPCEVTVSYAGNSATVETTDQDILCNTDGAYVTIDLLTNSVKGVKIIVSGSSADGQLKIYGDKKIMLILDGVSLTCLRGPAINNQCKKRTFFHLSEGKSNYLADASSYSAEPYYHPTSSADSEDRKGCLFGEGNLIFSGSGVLCVTGNYKHGIATDGSLYTRPGVTIVVSDAAKDALHAKGDSDEEYGICVTGGYVYAATAATAGKSMKTGQDVLITGGELRLYTSGGSEYDADEQDTSSPAGIKAGGSITVRGGSIVAHSTGAGGKGINADGNISIDGGDIDAQTTGRKYTYSSRLTSSPKGIKADGNIEINGGIINVAATGASDGSEGVESKATITVNGGELTVQACDDAMNAKSSITVNGGRVYCHSTGNDGIDTNGSILLTGGLVIASGTTSPEEGIDCDRSDNFVIQGGTIIGTGGSAISPSTSSTQRVVVYSGFQATAGNTISIVGQQSGTAILFYELPRSMNSMTMLFSSPSLTSGTYSVVSAANVVSYSEYWNGWYSEASIAGGTTLGTFTSESTVTTAGRNNNNNNNNNSPHTPTPP